MPIMDGFAVLNQLKSEASTRDIPVVIVSASNDLRNVVRGIQMGAEDYLPKPFEPTCFMRASHPAWKRNICMICKPST